MTPLSAPRVTPNVVLDVQKLLNYSIVVNL
jgi:hypothetical protein